MDGILVIRKEKGYTSHDVVAKLRGILHMKKIGHTGTLDPAAEGVLPVALGRGTRLVELLTEKEKTYEAVLRLGVSTDTQDMTGTVLSEMPVTVTEEEVREAVESFVGEQMQVPPMYSALKVNGKKLYELAREGKTIERKPRPVVFYEIRIMDISLPLVRISVTCSKGTYIRTLCNDIGEKLGCGGAMEELLRTRSGNFTLEESLMLSQVEEAVSDGTIMEKIVPVEEVLSMYPALTATVEGDRLLHNGNPLPETMVQGGNREEKVRMYKSSGDFTGIYGWDEKKEKYIPYVIEPSLGADRVVLAFLCAAYDEENIGTEEKPDMRTVLHFHPALAPVKIGVLPLSKKLNEGAEKVFTQLSKKYNCEFDDRGNIGKRYRRQDEIGTPFCITYDFDSEEDGAVTVRDRDTMEQERIKITDLEAYFADKFTF